MKLMAEAAWPKKLLSCMPIACTLHRPIPVKISKAALRAKDLGERMDDTLVVTMTDFGRTAFENGTGGTDHGWANCMLLMGGAVQRGSAAGTGLRSGGGSQKVIANWPGLERDQLHDRRDLQHTTDFRDVLGEIVSVHLGNQNVKTVLPQHEFKDVGLIA